MNPRFFRRRSIVVPTLSGWVLIVAVLTLTGFLSFQGLYSYLAQNRPSGSDIVIVEGWVPDNALRIVANDVIANNRRLVLTTGGPVPNGYYLSEYKSWAALSAASLRKLGVDSTRIAAVPAPYTGKDRTYESALALKTWLAVHSPGVYTADIYTYGPHSRRTLMLFRKAFNGSASFGVRALTPFDVNPGAWWTTSEGVRTVTGEFIAYMYALFFCAFQ